MHGRKKHRKRRICNGRKSKKKLVSSVNSSNTDKPVKPIVDNNNKSLSRTNSAQERTEMMVFHHLLRIGYKILRM